MAKVLVTPEMAKKWLETNAKNNRNISLIDVGMYARMMIEGKWYLSPDHIAFDDNGNLFNGQHRLSAVVMANIPVEMNVDFGGYDTNSMSVTDQGRFRRTSDVAKILGYDKVFRCNVVHSFIKNFHYVKLGVSNRTTKYSRNETIDLIEKYYYVCRFVYEKFIGNKVRNAGVSISVISALINGESEDLVVSFINEMSGLINDTVHLNVNHNAAAEAKEMLYYSNYKNNSLYSGGGHNKTVNKITFDCQRLLFKYTHNRKKSKTTPEDIFPVSEEQLLSFNNKLKEIYEKESEAM